MASFTQAAAAAAKPPAHTRLSGRAAGPSTRLAAAAPAGSTAQGERVGGAKPLSAIKPAACVKGVGAGCMHVLA